MSQVLNCFACGICIGQGHIETFPYELAGKTICGNCRYQLKKRGEIKLDEFRKLMADGTVLVRQHKKDLKWERQSA